MLHFILWYFSITLVGLLTFPLTYRLFPALADRGYSLSRALGLLVWGYGYWLLVSFGLLRNEIGGLLFALALVASLSVWALLAEDRGSPSNGSAAPGKQWQELLGWVKKNLRLVFSIEALFLVAFAAWAFVRANNPDTTGTEKPMEMAFINAILHSPSFPPHDPWLGGYAISYYYFGYVLAAMLAMFTATEGGLAFNLMLSLVFALSVISSYGLLYNLLAAYWEHTKNAGARLASILGAFFAPLFLVIMGNVEGFLELLHAYGIGWANSSSNFWLWLNMKDLSNPPAAPFFWNPRFWFWWRASRVLQDYDLRGNFIEVIDEFPFFSYLLGDLHPHVLAMPFGLLAGALALNLYLGANLPGASLSETNIFGLKIPVRRQDLAVMAVVLGGLAFLNTWDFPIYLAVICGAFILMLATRRGWRWDLFEDFLKFSIPLALASIVIYLPFYLGFSSQAGGILPNIIFPTRGAYLWIMFGILFVPIFLFLASLRGKRSADWKSGFLLAAGLILVLWAFSVLLGYAAGLTEAGRSFITSQGYSTFLGVLLPATLRRLEFGGGLLTLFLLIGTALSYLLGPKKVTEDQPSSQSPNILGFVLMFILLGGLLVLAPEFVYLRDQFGTRMNTVFKFYYEAWTLWSIAAAFGVVVLMRQLRGFKMALFSGAMAIVLLMGLTYPVLSLPNKTNNFNYANPAQRTLDGAAYLENNSPDDYAAIQWLSQAAPGVVVEAVGGSYTDFARVSTYSGQPSVLGWPGHESQWRGGSLEMGVRADDIVRLYTTTKWNEAEVILKRYDVRYVYLGSLERSTYVVDEDKFSANLSVVFKQGQVVIYALR